MSFDFKLNRALEHLEALERELTTWLKTKPYTLVDEPDPDGAPDSVKFRVRARRLRIERIEPVPDRFSLLIGDFLFNVRSALDHLALALAYKFTPSISDTQVGWSEFPIFGER